MAEVQNFIRTQMLSSQAIYDDSTNKSGAPAPAFQIGDLVFLATKNIRTARTGLEKNWPLTRPQGCVHLPIRSITPPVNHTRPNLSRLAIGPVLEYTGPRATCTPSSGNYQRE